MDLILWRHAEAEDARSGQSDLDRALTTKGERQAERMAEWLNRRLAASTRVLASPALRTRQTAQALGRPFADAASLAPGALPEHLIEAAQWPDSAVPVLLVGHQPTLGQLAARLLAGQAQSWSIRKAGVWWLRSRDGEADAGVVLQAVQAPEWL